MQNYTALAPRYKDTDPQTTSITFGWLLHLRWGAILSQIVLIGMVGLFFDIAVPLPLVCLIVFFEVTSNFLFYFLKKRQKVIPEWFFVAIMFIDVIFLTILLSQTGGAMNPFTFLYLLHVVMGSMLMRSWIAWSLGIFTIICYASFFMNHYQGFSTSLTGAMEGAVINGPVCVDVATLSGSTDNQLHLHMQGMFVAFAITTFSIIFFISRLRDSLDGYYETVTLLRNEKIKTEKLGALATLAAGAAHEFSTPLSTIAVAVGEMLLSCKERGLPDDILEDATLIKGQVAVCKEILEQLSADAGTNRGEALSQFTFEDLIDELKGTGPAGDEQGEIDFHCENKAYILAGPRQAITRILKGLIKNAFDASKNRNDSIIQASLMCDDTHFTFTITDQGEGMDESTLSQATEPFFTTKEPGKGMGLGLFLAQAIAERFHGDLKIQSQKDKGTMISLRLSLRHLRGST